MVYLLTGSVLGYVIGRIRSTNEAEDPPRACDLGAENAYVSGS
jgi:hypothetical protein